MRATVPVTLGLIGLLLSSCTPAFSVRLFNRSAHDIVVFWKSGSYAVTVAAGKDKIVGSVYDSGSVNPVVVKSIGTEIQFERIGDLWALPAVAIRAMRLAAAGSRECCVEYGADGRIFVLHATTLQRLDPQPAGFPLVGSRAKDGPNPTAEPSSPSRAGSP